MEPVAAPAGAAGAAAGDAEDDDDLDLEKELERELEGASEPDEEPQAGEAGPPAPGEGGTDAGSRGARAGGAAADLDVKAGADEADARKARDRSNQQVLQLLSQQQLQRYEAFRRASLSKRSMKRLAQGVTGQAPHPNSTIILCGISKMFVGELVEAAREVADSQGDSGPLRPSHVHSAYQMLYANGKIPHSKCCKRLRLQW